MNVRTQSLLISLFLSFLVNAEVYKWVDENGQVHYGEKLPENTLPLEIKGEVNTLQKQSYDFLPERKLPPSAAANSRVVMYATSWCTYCRKARKYFKSRGIPFTEYDIEKNEAAKNRFDSLGGRGVPLILVGDKRLSGFSPQLFESFYNR